MSNNFHYGQYDPPRRFPRNQDRSQSPRRAPRSPSPRQAPAKRSRSRDRDPEQTRLRTQDKPSNFTSRQVSPPERKRVSLDFKVFIKQKFLDQGICSFSSLDKIVRQCDIDDMLIDPTLEVPDVQGKILVIKGKSLDKKADAFTALMRIL